MDRYLSVCAIYLDEAPYLREWIEFHRFVGVERFFLYDHESTDEHLEVLAPYIDDGTVAYHRWPLQPGQIQAYDHCLASHGAETRWIAFIDIDEFLFSPTLNSLPQILVDYEQHPAVAANWAMFGTSGHLTKPDGLVIENYHLRKDYAAIPEEHVKCTVDPSRTEHCIGPHSFAYRDGFAVNEQHRPLDEPPFGFSGPVTWDRLRVNHYARRSWEEYQRKLARPRADTGGYKIRREETHERRERPLNAVPDDTIKAYLPELREAMERIDARRSVEVRGE
jgi:hypothetical protein